MILCLPIKDLDKGLSEKQVKQIIFYSPRGQKQSCTKGTSEANIIKAQDQPQFHYCFPSYSLYCQDNALGKSEILNQTVGILNQ